MVFMELALFLSCRKTPAAGFPGRLLYYGLVFTSKAFASCRQQDRVIQQFNSSAFKVVLEFKQLKTVHLADLFPAFPILD